VAGIAAVIGFVFIVIFNKRTSRLKMLEHELRTIRSEIEIEKASEDIEENNSRIRELEEEEGAIKRKIWALDNKAISDDVTNEELDKFFDERGF
jgi:peptidoglycan hydrolase CwlO-like protein